MNPNDPILDFSHIELTLICWVAIKNQSMEPLYFYVDKDTDLYFYNPWYYTKLSLNISLDLAYPHELKDYLDDGNYIWKSDQLGIAKKYSVLQELMK